MERARPKVTQELLTIVDGKRRVWFVAIIEEVRIEINEDH
jgi:hypothetical protein